MSGEELEKEIQKYIKHYDIYEQNKRLQQENKQLKEVINKANEFIEKNFIRYKDSENGLVLNELSLINIEEIKKLLEILEGEDNETN